VKKGRAGSRNAEEDAEEYTVNELEAIANKDYSVSQHYHTLLDPF
jgi:hypothetical protein